MMGSADYKTVDHAVDHHHLPDGPAQLTRLFAATGLYGHDSSRVAVYQVVPSCSCYRCVDLSYDRVAIQPGRTAAGSQGPVVKSWVSASRASMPHLVAVDG